MSLSLLPLPSLLSPSGRRVQKEEELPHSGRRAGARVDVSGPGPGPLTGLRAAC